MFGPAYVIVSTGLVRRKERQQELAGQTWDIALMDEAHYARRSNPTAGLVVQPRYGDLYRALKQTVRPRTRAFWLSTAMPMQLDVLDEDPEQDDDDTEVIEQLLRNRSEAGLRRE